MTTRRFLGALASFALAAAPMAGQQFSHDIPLAGLGNGQPAKPFGLAYEPGLDRIFVALAGSFGGPNDVVAVIDPAVDAVVATIQVGLYPEEIAFAYDSLGQLQFGAVTNSTSGSVSLFDPSLNVLGEVALPDPFGLGTCYPFGICWEPGAQRFLVSTLDGSGEVYAIDPQAMSVDAAASHSLPLSSGSRMLVHQGRLWNAATRYNASFTSADAALASIELATGSQAETLLLSEARAFFPAVQDLIALPDGDVLAGAVASNGLLYRFDGQGQLESTIHLPSASGAHGLALGPQGRLLAVCDLYADTLIVYDLEARTETASFALNTIGLGYGQPNDAVFAHGKLYLSSQATEEVLVFDQLPSPPPAPSYAGSLTLSSSTPQPGDPVTATVQGSGAVALLIAREGTGAVLANGQLDIGPRVSLRAQGWTSAQLTQTLPQDPALRGLHLWLQGAVALDTTPALTEARVLIVQ